MKLVKGNWYRCKDAFGDTWTGQYMGREQGMTCCVCEKGNNAHCFNVWHGHCGFNDYETLPFGQEHLPTILEDLGTSKEVIIS